MHLPTHKRLALRVAILWCLWLWLDVARAAEDALNDSGEAEYPDIAQLKNGGFDHRTNAVLIPDRPITIVTTGGAVPAQPLVRVTLESDPVGATFYQQSDLSRTMISPGIGAFLCYRIICTAPCQAMFPPGTQALALSYQGSPPHEAKPIRIEPRATHLRGKYFSRSRTRTAGMVTLGLAIVAGGILSYLGFSQIRKNCFADFHCTDEPQATGALIVAGLGTSLIGMAVAFVLLTRQDYCELQVSTVQTSDPVDVQRWQRPEDVATKGGTVGSLDSDLLTCAGQF